MSTDPPGSDETSDAALNDAAIAVALSGRPYEIADLWELPGNPHDGDDRAVADSLARFGQVKPIAVSADGCVIAGNTTFRAARDLLGWSRIAGVEMTHEEAEAKAYALADNRTAQLGRDDPERMVAFFGEIEEWSGIGWDEEARAEIAALIEETAPVFEDPLPLPPDETLPEVPVEPISKLGDLWILGQHRVLCGDSTDPAALAELMDGHRASVLHADPPYGMGKHHDGVVNDDLTGPALDEFQMTWWRTCRPHLLDNASVYLWGNAEDLWRLWWRAGLCDSERMSLRNEIVWDKKSAPGMASEERLGYTTASERCLFFMLGQQFLGNLNAVDFPEQWEPLRARLAAMAAAVELTASDLQRVCGVGMFSHWFSRSQFTLIPAHHYAALADAYPGHFVTPWVDLKAEWDSVRGTGRSADAVELDGVRSYFDNAHDVMRDVWEYPRVYGDERYSHATPKPVAMMERALRSSTPEGAVVLEPFGGSGSTLIAADRIARRAHVMEISPGYVDLIVRRWQTATGGTPVRNGEPVDMVNDS